ncbi:MAG: Asp-tRNA(Asn)/Glu-tRNA(Gln) amidotransferase subunit GatC [Pseudomonadota bacterium]
MGFSTDDVMRVARLARLSVADEDVEQVAADLQKIVRFMDELSAVDTEGVAPMAHPLGELEAALRADVPDAGIDRDRLQRDAPDAVDGFYRVPRVVE